MKVLVTGGCGYIGSHTVRALTAAGHQVVVLDSLVTGHRVALDERVPLIVGDLCDRQLLGELFQSERFDAVVHFAAFIEVGESVRDPLKFYENNVANTINLLQAMQVSGVRKLVFSSTCAVYGTPDTMPLVETMACNPASPYARAKYAVEWALDDSSAAWQLGYAALRYFNAAGAASDATIGEDHDPESHLIPNVLKVALGQRENVKIFGTDYETPDGTCLRDYIHVEDLAAAHVAAVEALQPGERRIYNTGTGVGASVREVIDVSRQVTGHAIPAIEESRRPGDVPRLFADSSKIQRELGWSPKYKELREIVASAWRWHQSHPEGYGDRRRSS
ncbi:MAG: UDP-glucose 4-epimerase GalE [Phycisphaerales bacterium]|nr:UDP-glucose 4-epimerase GalE [Phycisphaerales bacterium]MCB9862228.1 UDP-glucose 4-epimerase GalE [Phycisphaerales bacterium]